MFKKYDEYRAATEYASINMYNESKNSKQLGIFTLLLLTTIGVMGYVGFDSFSSSINTTIEVKRTDREYLNMLQSMDVDNLDIVINKHRQVDLSNALNDIVNGSYSKENTFYLGKITKEDR